MFGIVAKNKLQKIRKRGTYSRLLKKYRERYINYVRSNSSTYESNNQNVEPEATLNNTAENDVQPENVPMELNNKGNINNCFAF